MQYSYKSLQTQIDNLTISASGVSPQQLTTTSGDIVEQIPSLAGYATQSWANLTFVDHSEMTTISGDLVAQITAGGVTVGQLTTTSGDIVAQIPSLSGYATESWVTNEILTTSGDIVTNLLQRVTAGSGVFTTTGFEIIHNINSISHFICVTPAGEQIFDIEQISSIGTIYTQKGLLSDRVYATGGPASDGIPFDWIISL